MSTAREIQIRQQMHSAREREIIARLQSEFSQWTVGMMDLILFLSVSDALCGPWGRKMP